MSKTNTLPKFEDYKAPWEVNSDGEDIPEDEQQLDPAKLKKFLHGLLGDKARLQTTVTTVTGERDDLKTQLDAKTREGEGDEQKRQREHDDAVKAAGAAGDLKALKLEVALDIEGITPKQAKRLAARLTGNTREELESDAEGLVEDFGLGKAASKEDEEPAQPGGKPRRLRAAGDPDPDTKDAPPADMKSVNELFPR
jgi:hypothetical protein